MSLEPLYRAVAWLLVQFHTGLSWIFPADSGWAWAGAIILLTVAMRIVLFPLFVKQIHSSRKMQALQPQIAVLRKKYKNDKQRLNQEMMKLYQENGANPIAGCLPLLVQMPVFFGLFGVLRGLSDAHHHTLPNGQKVYDQSHGISGHLVGSAQNANIFGAHIGDTFMKSVHHGFSSALVITAVAVVISSTTTFFTVRSSMKRQPAMEEGNPMASAQKMMVYFAPLFGLFGINFPLGVLIYWVTTNSWTLAQQHYIYKRYPMPDPNAPQQGAGAGGPAAAKATQNGSSSGTSGKGGPNTLAARRARLKKAAETPEIQDDVPEAKVVRKQPVRQSRSKRTGTPPKR